LNDDLALREGHCGEQVEDLRRNLKAFGYDIGQSDEFDGWTQTVVRTFQMHFRPGCCDGVADAQTINTLERLLASHAS
jgi:N-acetylmuramoyl-L-alanine amidase